MPSDVIKGNQHEILFGSVADPGFSLGASRWGGTNFLHGRFLAKKYAKTKELDPVGGSAPAAPSTLGFANGLVYLNFVLKMLISSVCVRDEGDIYGNIEFLT